MFFHDSWSWNSVKDEHTEQQSMCVEIKKLIWKYRNFSLNWKYYELHDNITITY